MSIKAVKQKQATFFIAVVLLFSLGLNLFFIFKDNSEDLKENIEEGRSAWAIREETKRRVVVFAEYFVGIEYVQNRVGSKFANSSGFDKDVGIIFPLPEVGLYECNVNNLNGTSKTLYAAFSGYFYKDLKDWPIWEDTSLVIYDPEGRIFQLKEKNVDPITRGVALLTEMEFARWIEFGLEKSKARSKALAYKRHLLKKLGKS